MDAEAVAQALKQYKGGGPESDIVILSGLTFRMGPFSGKQGWFCWECLSYGALATVSGYPIYSADENMQRVFLSAGYFAEHARILVDNVRGINGDIILAIDPYAVGVTTRAMALAWDIFMANGAGGLADRVEVNFRPLRTVAPRISTLTFFLKTSQVLTAKWDGRVARVASSPAIPVLVDAAIEAYMRIANTEMEASFEAGEIDAIMDREETKHA